VPRRIRVASLHNLAEEFDARHKRLAGFCKRLQQASLTRVQRSLGLLAYQCLADV
jgi:hypothetical protein